MNTVLRIALTVAGLVIVTQAAAQVTFYEDDEFNGRSFTTTKPVRNFDRYGFNDPASSAVVKNQRWEVCDSDRFEGNCMVLRPGRYPSLAAMGLDDSIASARAIPKNTRVDDDRYAPDPAVSQTAQITLYENDRFDGRSISIDKPVWNFERVGFNDRASSAIVLNERWEVCQGNRFEAPCTVLRPGRYPSLAAMGLNDRISSARTVQDNVRISDNRYAPQPEPVYDNRRRNNERLYEAEVVSSRAVIGKQEQRCWIEQEQVATQARGDANIPGAIAGALIGGVLGHQVGGGRGKDLATAGGAVAGAAVGANVGRSGQTMGTRDVQRCANVPDQARPDYWDVIYNFRGQEYQMQMTVPPGRTVTVNDRGEPRA